MSKDIWHTTDETPKSYEDIAFYVDGYLYSSYYEAQYNQYGIFGADKVEKWCYAKDLSSYILALETENKDLSDKIGKLGIELEKTHEELEQSEICCSEWEKQALDYKAESIALSGKLERTHKALGYAIDVIQTVAKMSDKMSREYGETLVEQLDNIQAYCWQEGYVLTHEEDLEKAITAPEQKDVK